MGAGISQIIPPPATFTEHELQRLPGTVVLITGATSGVGYELAMMLYQAGAIVWVGGRTISSVSAAIDDIRRQTLQSTHDLGQLRPFIADLSDLATIKPAVDHLLTQESRLDVLFNNAAVSLPPVGSTSKQGHELMLATNCLAALTLTMLLHPLLQTTAAKSLPGTVRVSWATSYFVELGLPKGGGNILDNSTSPSSNQELNYAYSKLGNYCLASHFAAAETSRDGRPVIHLAQNPGNLKSKILRHTSSFLQFCISPLLYHAKYGAYTQLWTGFSSDVTENCNGAWIIPWGRLHTRLGDDIVNVVRSKQDGGTSLADAFVEWCKTQVDAFL